MKQRFTAVVYQEDEKYVAQCLDVDIASQGKSELEALGNLREALELNFDEPRAKALPSVRTLEIEISGDETCHT